MKGGYKRGSNRSKTQNRLSMMGEEEKYTFRPVLQKRKAKKGKKGKKTARKIRALRKSKKIKEVPVKLVIDNKPNPRNSLLQGLRSSIKPLKNVKVKLPTPRSLSMKTGSRRLISALVSNRFKQEMAPRATRRAKTI